MIDLHYYINTFLLRKSRKDTGMMTKWSLNCKIWPCGHLPLLGSAQIHKSCYLCHLRTQPYSKYYGNKLLDKFLCRIHFWGGIYKHICIFICVFACETEADAFGDGTHLRGMRGTAVGVEAAVMTCRICSSADRPPPTWKATWSALLCRGKGSERRTHSEEEAAKSGWCDSQAGRGICERGSLSFSNRSSGLNSETRWSQEYPCLISKVHTLTQSSQVSMADKCSPGFSEHQGGLSQTAKNGKCQ